ncbi:MAG: hypothetical protein LBV32_04640 [Tannerellaceae bacterium]|jgi:hypothetical protein|nr:hypothetical protein [Tannerellaceae bacterium]
MKIITSLFLIFIPVCLWGQAVTEKNQSVSIEMLGIEYSNELPLSDKHTVRLHGGLVGGYLFYEINIGDWYNNNGVLYSLNGKFGADFRYYYNLSKREMKGKSTFRNTGNFWAADVSYYTPSIMSSKHTATSHIVALSPYWGIRRVYKSNLFFELNLGITILTHEGMFGGTPLTGLKFGYVF